MTGKQQMLEILGDLRPHSHREIYHRMRGNPNVISKLRKEGYTIAMERRGGEYWYQLQGLSARPRPQPAPLADGTVPELDVNQLSLEDVT
jgi:hypothetical protein